MAIWDYGKFNIYLSNDLSKLSTKEDDGGFFMEKVKNLIKNWQASFANTNYRTLMHMVIKLLEKNNNNNNNPLV